MNKLREVVKKTYISHEIGKKQLKLHEQNKSGKSKDKPYTGKIQVADDIEFLLLRDINHLVHNIKYTNKTPPDCDYILINLTEKEIYFIELKGSSKFQLNKVKKQLQAGQKWLEHLCFCSSVDEQELNQFKRFQIWWEYDVRMCQVIEPFHKESGILKIQGNVLILSKLQIMLEVGY